MNVLRQKTQNAAKLSGIYPHTDMMPMEMNLKLPAVSYCKEAARGLHH